MKKVLLTILGLALMNIAFAQTLRPDFLDGQIMFKIKGEVLPSKHIPQQKDPHDFSLEVRVSDFPQIEAILQDYTVTKLERPSYFTQKPSLMNIFRVHFSDFSKIDELTERLAALEQVEFASKSPIYKTSFVPNDTYHSGNDKWFHTLVGSEAAWNISTGNSGIKVAIVDNAVFSTHADLTAFKQRDVADNDNNATPPDTYQQDASWSHGTHCAGLATANINNNTGIASLGGNVELIGIKATPDNAPSSNAVWYGYAGVQWACQNGAHVVSMSFGGPSSDPAMQTLINAYPNIVFLAAAGNDGNTVVQYPAGYTNVVGVGSVNSTDARSSFSNYNGANTFVDIASPGGYSFGGLLSSVYTTGGNGYARMGGTSMATPFAAGLVGLMLSVNPTLSPSQILACLTSTGVNINQNIGPRIDALAALQCVQATTSGSPIPDFAGLPTSITEGDDVSFFDNSASGGNAITSWEWSFPGGSPSSHLGQSPPNVTYLTAGTYDVSLKVINSQDSATATKTGYINVQVQPYGDWIKQNSGFSTAARGINHISIVDANTVWALAYDGSGGGANIQEFTKTTDGGNTWTPGSINVGNAGLGIAMIHAYDASTAWLSAYPTAGGQTGGIWKTTNGGTTWTRQNSASYNNAASFTNVVHFWDQNEGFCQGDPINGDFELYRTTNGGTTWTAVPGGNIPNPLNGNEFGYTRQIEVVGDNVWFTTSVGRIYHSSDRGINWSVYTSPVADFGGAITTGVSANLSMSSATRGLIVDINGNVWETNNSGATWSAITPTGTVHTNGLCYVEGTSIVFSTGAGTTPGSSYSADDGLTWNIIDTEQHLFVEFLNQSIGWSGWFNTSSTQDGMWKWNDLSSPLAVAFSGTPSNVCVADTVDFSDLTTGGTVTTWSWTFPGGNPSTSNLPNPQVTYATPGIYPVSLTAGDGTSQSTYLDTAHVNVVAMAGQPSAIIGNMTPCPNTVETYQVNNTSGVFYNWNVGNGWAGTSSSNVINITFNDTSGTLSVTADNVCGSSPASTANINIIADPTASFSFADNGGSVVFTNTTTGGTVWAWDFGDTNGSSAQNPTHNYTANGNYTVTLIATNACGDSDTTTQVLNIVLTGTSEILDAFSSILVYPNPTTDRLTIDGLPVHLIGHETLEVIDVLGRTVLSQAVTDQNLTLDVSTLTNGVYSLTLKGEQKAFKFVKR